MSGPSNSLAWAIFPCHGPVDETWLLACVPLDPGRARMLLKMTGEAVTLSGAHGKACRIRVEDGEGARVIDPVELADELARRWSAMPWHPRDMLYFGREPIVDRETVHDLGIDADVGVEDLRWEIWLKDFPCALDAASVPSSLLLAKTLPETLLRP